jgi:hypothetical protein
MEIASSEKSSVVLNVPSQSEMAGGGGARCRGWTTVELTVNEERNRMSILDQGIEHAEELELSENISAHELLRMVYRGKVEVSPMRMRAAIESLPYETPKLSATAIATMDGKSFAEALERALERSETVRNGSPPLINSSVEQLPASVANKPFVRPNYRRF